MGEWERVAEVFRSECHGRTWVGIELTNHDLTQIKAGPLNVVKAALVESVMGEYSETRWKHAPSGEGDTWSLEAR
jgi:hypothetical protein